MRETIVRWVRARMQSSGSEVGDRPIGAARCAEFSLGMWPAYWRSCEHQGLGHTSPPWGDAVTGINRADTANENSKFLLVRRVVQQLWRTLDSITRTRLPV